MQRKGPLIYEIVAGYLSLPVFVVFLILIAGLLTGCAPDPRNLADADRTRLEAEQAAADQVQTRQQQQKTFDLEHAQAQQVSDQWVKSVRTFITVWMIAATIGATVATVATGIGWSVAAIGAGRATAQAAMVRANLIALDPKTRAYPLFLQHIGQGKFTLTDMTTGQVKQLDVRDSGDRLLIQGVNRARLAGAVAYEARHAKQASRESVLMDVDQVQNLLDVE